jgi:hypothetical protein
MLAHKNPPEATWDAPRFAYDGANLLSWNAGSGAIPGALARGRQACRV